MLSLPAFIPLFLTLSISSTYLIIIGQLFALLITCSASRTDERGMIQSVVVHNKQEVIQCVRRVCCDWTQNISPLFTSLPKLSACLCCCLCMSRETSFQTLPTLIFLFKPINLNHRMKGKSFDGKKSKGESSSTTNQKLN